MGSAKGLEGLRISLISIVLSTYRISATDFGVCPVKLASSDHSTSIYTDVLKWKEPVTKSDKDSVQFECKSGFLQNELDEPKEQFICDKGLYNGTYKFPDLLCRSDYHSHVDVRKVPSSSLGSKLFKCDGPNMEVLEVSRKIDSTKKTLYRSCIDKDKVRTLFSFKPTSSDKLEHTPYSDRHDVWGFDGFGKNSDERVRLSQGYVKKIQKRRLTESFREKYNRGKEYPYYFNRGHLIAYADYDDEEDKKVTVEYINAAPQWEDFNKHSWSLVEREARKMVNKDPNNWEFYSGTFGTIPTTRGPLYLVPVFDSNGKFVKGTLPVPLVFWKVAFNVKDRSKSRAFVGVNNPEIKSPADISAMYRLCPNPIKAANGKTILGDEYKGFTYECPIDDLLQTLKSDASKIVL